MAKTTTRTNPIFILFIFALLCVVLTLVIVYALGFRYTSTDDGIKFFGKYKGGIPYNGTVYYPDGLRAKLEYEAGTITYSNGDVYVGEITGILRNGTGKMTYYGTNETYTGPFVNDAITGNGTYVFSNGTTYEGALVDNKKNGFGKITFSDGSTYEGYFTDDMMNGYGVYNWADGSSYKGNFVNNIKQGQGEYTFANGDFYSGDWVNDMRTGYGTFTWANGESYQGQFVDGQMHGYGTYTWMSGRRYEGYFEYGKVVVKEE